MWTTLFRQSVNSAVNVASLSVVLILLLLQPSLYRANPRNRTAKEQSSLYIRHRVSLGLCCLCTLFLCAAMPLWVVTKSEIIRTWRKPSRAAESKTRSVDCCSLQRSTRSLRSGSSPSVNDRPPPPCATYRSPTGETETDLRQKFPHTTWIGKRTFTIRRKEVLHSRLSIDRSIDPLLPVGVPRNRYSLQPVRV